MNKQAVVSKFSHVEPGAWRHVISRGVNPCRRPLALAGRGGSACCTPAQAGADI